MKTFGRNFIIASSKQEWEIILLIYSVYIPSVPNYDWIGPFQFFRIHNNIGTDWNPYSTLKEVYESEYLKDYIEIPLIDFLKNY